MTDDSENLIIIEKEYVNEQTQKCDFGISDVDEIMKIIDGNGDEDENKVFTLFSHDTNKIIFLVVA